MAILKKDLRAVQKDIKALEKKLEKLIKAFDLGRKAKAKPAAKKAVAKKAAPKVAKKVRKPAKKTVVKKKRLKLTATDKVLGIIRRSKKGVNVSTIKTKTGFDDKKVRNIIFRTTKERKIKKVGRGIYVGA
jgi:cell division septum initiation protein DivIVA